VLDDLPAPGDVQVLLDQLSTGTVLVTSRRATGWRVSTTLALGVLEADCAREMLVQRVREDWPDADLADTGLLCAELGNLPLAIEQAAAYISETRTSLVDYLGLLDRHPAQMLRATAVDGDVQRTLAQVWRVTLDRLGATSRAGELLRQAAWYAPANIPRDLLVPDRHPDTDQALGRLAAFSMVSLTADSVSVHRLVQSFSRTGDPDDPHRQPSDVGAALRAATVALTRTLDGLDSRQPASWPRHRQVLPHALALCLHADPGSDTDTTCQLLDHVGGFLSAHGVLATGVPLLARLLLARQRLNGPDDTATLNSRNNLALARRSAGDARRAVAEFESTLSDYERILGGNHRSTLTCRSNLASALESAGDLMRATRLFESTLADRERVLGALDPDTLTSRNNLAGVYESAGDLDRAISLYTLTLAARERALGADHPDTLVSRANLAHAYAAAGEADLALPLHERTLRNRERVLGPDHIATLTSRNNLAFAHQARGGQRRAAALFEAAAAGFERVLSADHPDTLTARNNLALSHRAGDAVRAIALLTEVLRDCERALGADHRLTLVSRTNLAGSMWSSGDRVQAVALLVEVAAASERVLGPDHPDTRDAQANLAAVREALP
jgi:tetratricopeptide (TPR) repeat protein